MANGKGKQFVQMLSARLRGGVTRFSAAGAMTLLLCGLGTAGILGWDSSEEWVLGCLWGLAAAVVLRLLCERYGCAGKAQWVPWAAAMPAGGAAVMLWHAQLAAGNDLSGYWPMAYAGALAAAACLACWLLYTRENEAVLFGALLKNLLFCAAVALVINLGLLLCLGAVDVLLYHIPSETYEIVSLAVWSVLFLNLYFAYLPRRGDVPTVPRAYTALTGYAALPVYLLLLAVLYGYTLKILFTWSMPSGRMNWYGSVALAAFVFFWLGLRMHPNALVQKYLRWGWALLIPVEVVQSIGIAIRLHAYGLTAARWLSLACLALGLLAMVMAALRRGPRHWFAAAAIVALAVTVTPLNAVDVPRFCQAQRLKAVLTANGMWDGSVISPAAASLSEADSERIESCCSYLESTKPALWRSAFVTQATEGSFADTYGFEPSGGIGVDVPDWRNYSLSAQDAGIPVAGWRTAYPLSGGDTRVQKSDGRWVMTADWSDGTSCEADLTAYTEHILAAYTENNSTLAEADRLVKLPDGRALYLTYFSCSLENDNVSSIWIDGFLLVP